MFRIRVVSVLVLSVLLAQPAFADEGFTPLFNGKNLDGWKTKKGEALDGKTEAYNGRFKVQDEMIVIDPKVKGDVIIETARSFKDVHVKFQFLPGAGCNNDLFLRGAKFDLKKGVKNMKENEWNDFEIVAKGGAIEFKCNGQLVQTIKAKADSSPLGIRAEYGSMHVRSLQFKE